MSADIADRRQTYLQLLVKQVTMINNDRWFKFRKQKLIFIYKNKMFIYEQILLF